ncbi:TPA: fimbrial protein [Photobacterium damselae]
MNNIIYGLITTVIFFLSSFNVNAVEVNFDGELIDYPCEIISGSPEDVIFLTRAVKYFHDEPGKTPPQEFTIKLKCDPSINYWNVVKTRFTGNEEPEMGSLSNQFLRVSGVNQGFLGISILDVDGETPVIFGQNTLPVSIVGLDYLDLKFSAYVQATNKAIANKLVVAGDYEAIAAFELIYE